MSRSGNDGIFDRLDFILSNLWTQRSVVVRAKAASYQLESFSLLLSTSSLIFDTTHRDYLKCASNICAIIILGSGCCPTQLFRTVRLSDSWDKLGVSQISAQRYSGISESLGILCRGVIPSLWTLVSCKGSL